MNNAEDLTIKDLISVIWQSKMLIVVVSMLFSFLSIGYALSLKDQYKSTALLTSSSSDGRGLASLASQFGGIASFAGVNLAGGGSDKSVIAIEVLETWGFLEQFIKEHNLAAEVYAVNAWDKELNKIQYNQDLYDEKTQRWKKNGILTNESSSPTGWTLYKEIKKRIVIEKDVKTGLFRISVEHFSPYVSKKWVDLLVKSINTFMRQKDRDDAFQSIEYLNQQISKTSNAEMKTVFYQLIEEQTKKLMLAEVSDEYIFKTISPAKVAEEKSGPRRALIVIVGSFLGLVFSILVLLVRHLIITAKNNTVAK